MRRCTMAIFTIGDLHLSLGGDKAMDKFPGWENYVERISENWHKMVKNEDTVIVAGDSSWGMTLEQSLPDFRFIDRLPGKKIILKGNHDYWWSSMNKMKGAFAQNGLSSLHILHNNSYEAEGVSICGSRGWLFENGQAHDGKIVRREAMRIEASLQAARDAAFERILFLHYPPLCVGQVLMPFIDLMHKYGIKRCYYGHIHGAGHKSAVCGEAYGIRFYLISADFLGFTPLRVEN